MCFVLPLTSWYKKYAFDFLKVEKFANYSALQTLTSNNELFSFSTIEKTRFSTHLLPRLLLKNLRKHSILVKIIFGARAGLRGGNGDNCLGPSAPSPPPPWWHLFVLCKIFLWKIVVIQKRYKNTTVYSDIALSIINDFFSKFDFLSVLVITTECK